MAEVIQRDGTWAFDGSTIRITPGLHRSVPLFRQTYGEVAVPLAAVSDVVYESERRHGRLRMRLREGADPLLQATGGRLPDAADPYRLAVDADRSGIAEYVAEEIRHALLLDEVPKEPTASYLLPGPPVPVSVRSSDGTVSFDGAQVRIDWADTSDRIKRATGPRIICLGDLVQVEWLPNSGHEDGFLRFVTRETVFSKLPPERDPYTLDLWGSVRRDLLTALVAAAVTARRPHPSARTGAASTLRDLPAAAVPAQQDRDRADHHDVLLRRLRELGELHRDGVLTDEEFAMTKAAVLRGFE
ncbi:hypothetical protein J2Z21_002461 [Streptomyces griseochromogenes]|uniref:Tat pathway signal sequence domain protein n=1 Tax=Streptomyces griseochromogenes TaxID=68214 RepID=A0A1B1AQX8_9ACTN|nr:DUF4429 domain-containing protein [Streptomyces griseochromogenes]ANP48963.1 Tat pathway signal sequence domain protein [Streptomyces griseochromogenes]MBP2049530.1 hypothetical protein [Streptomyces griseochromogenes]